MTLEQFIMPAAALAAGYVVGRIHGGMIYRQLVAYMAELIGEDLGVVREKIDEMHLDRLCEDDEEKWWKQN